jgi:NADH-quinone oxidoreductase subunit J
LFRGFWKAHAVVPEISGNIGNTKELGKLIYTQYLYAFEIAALLLLVAIVAAVALTLRRRKDSKYFSPGDAVKVKSGDRLRIVKMKAESIRSNGDSPDSQASTAVTAEQN